jgi:hypothetical protein
VTRSSDHKCYSILCELQRNGERQDWIGNQKALRKRLQRKNTNAYAHKARAFVFKRPSRRGTRPSDAVRPFWFSSTCKRVRLPVAICVVNPGSHWISFSLVPTYAHRSPFAPWPSLTGSPYFATNLSHNKTTGDLRSPVHVTDGHQSTQFPGCAGPFWMFD